MVVRFPAVTIGFVALFSIISASADAEPPPLSSASLSQAEARDFLDLLILDKSTASHAGLIHREGFAAVVALAADKKPVEAVRAFERYFLGKLRDPLRYGLSANDVSPRGEGVAGRWLFPTAAFTNNVDLGVADDLLAGRLDGKEIGRPGHVNWLHPLSSLDQLKPAEPKGLPDTRLLFATGCMPLVQAYLATGDEKYIRGYAAFLDDWARHSTLTATHPHPCLVPMGMTGVHQLVMHVRALGGLAAAIPETRQDELLPPGLIARVLGKYWNELVLLQALYLRTNTHNWTPGSEYLLTALIFDEFKAAPILFRLGRRRSVEDNAVTQNLRDGSENQQCPWYNENYVNGVSPVFPLFEARNRLPAWQEQNWVRVVKDDPDWGQEIREHMAARISYQLRIRSPQGSWPIGVRGTDKRQGFVGDFVIAPEAFADPENRRIRAAIEAAAWPSSVRSITTDPGLRPTYHSEWFPYGGYNIVREGWERDSGYGAMFCSPRPGAYGGRRSRSNNNFFGLAAFGQDLVVEDKFDRYGLMGSPIEVDGLPQDFHAGFARVPVIAGHKAIPAAAWTEPAEWRWHASDHFNVMEGIYEGPYAKTDSVILAAPQVPVSMNQGSVPLEQTLQGMRHQRWVQFVRDARLWIVTDRLRGKGPHSFAQHWYLPLEPGKDIAFAENEIEVDAEARRIRTVAASKAVIRGEEIPKANVSLHSFGPADLAYATKALPQRSGHAPYGQYRVTLSWKVAGETSVVTVIHPRAPGVDVKADIAPKPFTAAGATGFEADLPEGGRVYYLATTDDAPLPLALGSVTSEGESLLVVERAGHTSGIALGCRAFAVSGKRTQVVHPDFEFTFAAGADGPEIVPIHCPISPVEIGPGRNVFTDKVSVTMATKSPGVEIRYTLDGGEPTPQSALYTGPVTIRSSAIVKARAYRPGVTANPPQNSGTHATATSRAVFDKKLPVRAVAAASVRRPQPGLVARYYEDDWRQLWLRLDSLTPVAEKRGVAPFDLAVVPDSNPPLGTAAAPRAKFFAVEYAGYVQVPETGIYTFHAPRESVIPETDPGYELRVFLGQHVEPYGYRAQAFGLEEWYPATRLHAQGTWSIALEKGLHPIQIVHLDYRTDGPARLNQPGLKEYVWSGVTPDLRMSGPSLAPQPIPADWLFHGE